MILELLCLVVYGYNALLLQHLDEEAVVLFPWSLLLDEMYAEFEYNRQGI